MEPETVRSCAKCGVNKSANMFRKYNAGNYSNTCKKCLNEMDKQRKKDIRQKRQETFLAKCEKCGCEKVLKEFAKLKKFYKRKICLGCYPLFVREQKTEWCKKEHDTNMNYRIKKSLAARLRSVLNKTDTTMNYIGCNIQYLREWFEFNFEEGMSWDNYGSYWSIDHVLPVRKFDLTVEKDKMLCWNWTNLMPTTVKYNSSKKSVIDMEQVDKIIDKIEEFKEKGSTTKWFSSEFMLTKELAISKQEMEMET